MDLQEKKMKSDGTIDKYKARLEPKDLNKRKALISLIHIHQLRE